MTNKNTYGDKEWLVTEYDYSFCPREVDVEKFDVDNPEYQRRFLDLVSDSTLQKLGEGAVLSEDKSRSLVASSKLANIPVKGYTLVHFIGSELIEKELADSRSNFSQLVAAFKNTKAFKNDKLFFNPFRSLHISFHLADQQKDSRQELKQLLAHEQLYQLRISGLTFRERIGGRIFLCVNGEVKNGKNFDRELRQKLADSGIGNKKFQKVGIAILNLKENLTLVEAAEISEIFKLFADKTLFDLTIDELSWLEFYDDLLIVPPSVTEIPFFN